MPDYALLEEKEEPSADKSAAGSGEQHSSAPPSSSTTSSSSSSSTSSVGSHRGLSLDPLPTPSPSPQGSSFPFSPSSVVSLTPSRRFASPSPTPSAASNVSAASSRPSLSRGPSTAAGSGSGSGLKPNPEEHANPLSFVCYSWLSSLVDLGATRPLSDGDLFEVRTDYAAKVASARFQREWAKEVKRAAAAGDRSKASLLGPFNNIYGRVSPHTHRAMKQHTLSTRKWK